MKQTEMTEAKTLPIPLLFTGYTADATGYERETNLSSRLRILWGFAGYTETPAAG